MRRYREPPSRAVRRRDVVFGLAVCLAALAAAIVAVAWG